MPTKKVIVDGVERTMHETMMGSPLTVQLVALIGDKLNGKPWSVTMQTFAELSAWLAQQLQAGVDAVAPGVDAAFVRAGVAPSVQVAGDEEIVPDARTEHARQASLRL